VKKKNRQRPHGRGTARGRRTAKIQFFRESRGKAARLFGTRRGKRKMWTKLENGRRTRWRKAPPSRVRVSVGFRFFPSPLHPPAAMGCAPPR